MSELLCCLRDICGHARKLSAVARALMPACVFNILLCDGVSACGVSINNNNKNIT